MFVFNQDKVGEWRMFEIRVKEKKNCLQIQRQIKGACMFCVYVWMWSKMPWQTQVGGKYPRNHKLKWQWNKKKLFGLVFVTEM